MPPDAPPARDERTSDQPLTDPNHDLLGVASHAAVLARAVNTTPTPFTIGVYGEWGAGKTTFVRFVEHYLARENAPPAERTLFVHFEGWQHRTADELWRALMLEVARAVYRHIQGEDAVAPYDSEEHETPPLRRFLARYAIGGEPPAEKPQDQYWSFVQRLDSTLYGGISKHSPEALRLDQNEAVLAAVSAALAALSATSPWMAGLRQLVRFDTTLDAATLFQRERNEATRERIESRREFQEALASLLKMVPDGERVCVFLDDLDRCMPDVVLDLLEAIKIFLHVEKMVFVVAADEELIGKGLRLRYRDLLEGSAGTQEGEYLARKGQEYFEKIIQLRINLPECTPEHAHRFIAAQYPEWTPATDIILSAVGSNPRRLKQYCSWLTFRRRVDQAEREKKNREEKESDPHRRRRQKRGTGRESYLSVVTDEERAARAALFDKLIAMASRDPECVALLHGLARDEDFAALARELEDQLAESAVGADSNGGGPAGTAAPDNEVPAGTHGDGARESDAPARILARLRRRIQQSGPLLKLFQAAPALSAYARRDVETLAAMADLHPHPEFMLTAADGPLMRAMRYVAQPGNSAPERIFQDDLAKLLGVWTAHATLFEQLIPLADEGWAAGARALETALQTDDGDGLSDPWKALFQQIRRLVSMAPADASPAALLLQSPQLSEILPEEVRALASVSTLPRLGQPHAPDTPAGSVPASDDDRRRLARAVFEMIAPEIRSDVLARLELRQWAASHYLELRGFARLNGLERQWPELARLLRTDRATLRALEGEAMRPGSIAPELRAVWDRYSGDERLRRFLVLKPLVSDIAPAEVREYFSVSQTIAPATESVAAAPPSAAVPQTAITRPHLDYADVTITLVEQDAGFPESALAQAQSNPPQPVKFEVTLDGPGGTVKTMTEVPWAQLLELIPSLYRPELAEPGAQTLVQGMSQRPRSVESVLRAQGALMWRWVFTGEVGTRMQELHATGGAYRLLLNFPPSLSRLPWETLFLEKERSFLGLTQRYSIVRYTTSAAFPTTATILAPLRILVVLVNGRDAELDLDGEWAAIDEAVRPGLQDGRVLVQVLENEGANFSELLRALRTFRPQILHFAGHGVIHEGQGALVLHGSDGRHVTTAAHMATLLRDAGVSLAFLNACHTATAVENDIIASVAGSLLDAGVPAVIAAQDKIEDAAALLFTREWYRAFAEGYSLEPALAEARKRLSVERWDWSAFTLFSSTRDLDELVFPQGSFRKA